MTAKEKHRYRKLNDLQREGVKVRKTSDVRFNSGSETSPHVVAKALCSFVMSQAGWVVNGEVQHPNGELDVFCWGRKTYMNYAIEVETSPEEGTHMEYIDQYVRGYPVDELLLVNCSQMPSNFTDALAWVSDQLPAQI